MGRERYLGIAVGLTLMAGCSGVLDEPGRTQAQVRLEGRVKLEIHEAPGLEETWVWLRDQASGIEFRLFFEEPPEPAWHPGDSYVVTGLREGRDVLVEGYDPVAIASSEEVAATRHALSDHPQGERRMIVILADTTLHATDTQPAHPFPPDIVEIVAGLLWTNDLSVSGLIATSTNGVTFFPPDVDGDGAHDIYGPYVVPEDLHTYDWKDFLEGEAVTDGADLSLYRHRLYVYSHGSGGSGTLGCDYGHYTDGCEATVSEWDDHSVYAHELGHNLGLHHTSGSDDVMSGMRDRINLFNAPHAEELGAYQHFPEAIVTPTESGTYTVRALGMDPTETGPPFMLKIPKPDSPDHYYVSYRRPVGYDWDQWHLQNLWQGAFVHRNCMVSHEGTLVCERPHLLGYPLVDGETWDLGEHDNDWRDPDDGLPNGIVLTQVSHTADTLTVSLTLPACGNGACDANESCDTCPTDCGECGACGDGSCNTGEDCASCAADCGSCPFCGDGACNADETCASCEVDCGSCAYCGDGSCNGDESCSTCATDCGSCTYCGDGTCNGSETCDSCSADCGACACLAKDAWCSSDTECCSGKCRGRSGAERCKG